MNDRPYWYWDSNSTHLWLRCKEVNRSLKTDRSRKGTQFHRKIQSAATDKEEIVEHNHTFALNHYTKFSHYNQLTCRSDSFSSIVCLSLAINLGEGVDTGPGPDPSRSAAPPWILRDEEIKSPVWSKFKLSITLTLRLLFLLLVLLVFSFFFSEFPLLMYSCVFALTSRTVLIGSMR